MNTRSRSRSRFTRHDVPFIVLGLLLLVMFLASLTAHAAEASALDQVASEVAAKVAGDLAGNSIMGVLSDFTLAGVLWFYSRRFYEDKKETDAKVLAQTERYATLAERIASALDNLAAGKPSTGRFPRDHDPHNAG